MQVIQLPRNSISLNGSQSTDDHDSLSYEWSLSPESKDKVVEMQVSQQKTAAFNYCCARCPLIIKRRLMAAVCACQGVRTPILQLSAMQEGDYTFQLTVTDSSGQQDTAQVTVIVQPGKRVLLLLRVDSSLLVSPCVCVRCSVITCCCNHSPAHFRQIYTHVQYQHLWFLNLLSSVCVCRKQQASSRRRWTRERVDAAGGPNHTGWQQKHR